MPPQQPTHRAAGTGPVVHGLGETKAAPPLTVSGCLWTLLPVTPRTDHAHAAGPRQAPGRRGLAARPRAAEAERRMAL
eukprot:1396511-Prymnesium_polylepis.1